MLPDECGAVYGVHRLVECDFDYLFGEQVFLRLPIDGEENGFVRCEKVCIGGREAFAIVIYGVGEREFDEVIWLAVGGAEGAELFLHEIEFGEMLIGWVVAAGEHNGVVRSEAGERVDVRIGVVACEVSVRNHQDSVGVEERRKFFGDLRVREAVVSVGRELSLRGSEESAVSVAFDATAFQNEVLTVFEGGDDFFVKEEGVEHIVAVGGKFKPPAVECEIEREWS